MIKLVQNIGQVLTREGPLERFGDLLVVILEVEQTFLKLGQRREVVRCEDLALNTGEVDFDLVKLEYLRRESKLRSFPTSLPELKICPRRGLQPEV